MQQHGFCGRIEVVECYSIPGESHVLHRMQQGRLSCRTAAFVIIKKQKDLTRM